jgi:hypothetical protein
MSRMIEQLHIFLDFNDEEYTFIDMHNEKSREFLILLENDSGHMECFLTHSVVGFPADKPWKENLNEVDTNLDKTYYYYIIEDIGTMRYMNGAQTRWKYTEYEYIMEDIGQM